MIDSVIIDIETMNNTNRSVILSVGMVAIDSSIDYEFDELIKGGYYAKLDAKSQAQNGRSIGKQTLEWWKTQGESASHVLTPKRDDMHWKNLMNDMIFWLEKEGVNRNKAKFYSRGSHFDFAVLNDLFRIDLGVDEMTTPWRYWNIHDSKTVVDTLLGHDVKVEPEGFIHHHALHDAAREYLKIQKAIYIFQETLEKK